MGKQIPAMMGRDTVDEPADVGATDAAWVRWLPLLRAAMLTEMSRAPVPSESHGEDHIDRVWSRVLALGEELGADLEVLAAATFLHDLGRHHVRDEDHGALSAELAVPILERLGFPAEKRAPTLFAIARHDLSFDDVDRTTLESRILFDADKLDTFGVVGVTRAIRSWYGRVGIDFILGQLDRRLALLSLPQSRRLAADDYAFARDFFVRLADQTGASVAGAYVEDREDRTA